MFSVYDGYEKIVTEVKTVSFAGANTSNGFEGLYGDIANERELERVYIIKGAAGTGKSTIMRRIAETCETEGYTVGYYLCGSDPESLDCVVIDGRIAVLDGTYPHSCDMKYPGCASSLIELSKFWDTNILEKERDEIIFRSAEKSAEYASAYRYIKAAEQLENERYTFASRIFDSRKAEKFIDRFIKSQKIKGSTAPRVKKNYSHGLTMRGKQRIDLLKQAGGEILTIKDTLATAPLYMDILYNKLERMGTSFNAFYMPLRHNITAISLDDNGTSIIVADDNKTAKSINLKRFETDVEIEGARGRIMLAGRCEKECTDDALVCLEKAAEHHFRLEDIYMKSMDFESLGIYTAALCDEILFRLKNKI